MSNGVSYPFPERLKLSDLEMSSLAGYAVIEPFNVGETDLTAKRLDNLKDDSIAQVELKSINSDKPMTFEVTLFVGGGQKYFFEPGLKTKPDGTKYVEAINKLKFFTTTAIFTDANLKKYPTVIRELNPKLLFENIKKYTVDETGKIYGLYAPVGR